MEILIFLLQIIGAAVAGLTVFYCVKQFIMLISSIVLLYKIKKISTNFTDVDEIAEKIKTAFK